MYQKLKLLFESKNRYRLVFLTTFFSGLFIHFYKISNNLLNHDSIYNYYSMFFIAFTAVIVVDILKIQNIKTACLSGMILISAPAITETLFFGFTSDGFALAMLLSAISVWFILRNEGKKCINYIISVICLTLSIATYQAYLSFALVLLIAYGIKNSSEKSEYYIDKKIFYRY